MQKHFIAVNKIMLERIAGYCTLYSTDEEIEQLTMYADDIAHNASALNAFNETKDWQTLYDSVYEQDTEAREHFMDVLDYLADNALAKSAY